jgi:hypothetical protein
LLLQRLQVLMACLHPALHPLDLPLHRSRARLALRCLRGKLALVLLAHRTCANLVCVLRTSHVTID